MSPLSSRLSIVTMRTTKTLSMFPPITKLPLVKKKILKLLEKNIKLKKKLKKKENPKGGKLKIKKTNPLYKKKMKKFQFFFYKN
jgi:hypothetical protein